MNSNDQYPMGRPDETTSGSSRTYAMSGKIMLSAIVILFFVVILMVFLHLYARWYLLRARRRHFRRRSRNRRSTMVFFAADPSAAAVASRGLDPAVIKSLPVFAFSESTHKDLTECAVCLSEFEEGESGRVLPGCKHTFHVDCIDMWFHSHSTCPLCRSLVEPLAGSEVTMEEQVVITISPEPVSATEPGSSSGSGSSVMPTEDSMRKPAAIEVPRRNFSEFEDDLNRNSPANHSFRSPMSRMLSFTRMLSRGNASSPIAGDPPQSPSSNCRIAMTESDIERGGEEDTR
ncbi:hypothetical protein BRARA_E02489 [Brassica rapa]|uniref:RING-type E3 ubiquitin transferase n=2 Tax=Brassica TaxID=3705 RepID=A0A816TY91_BRANA|nr:RING-H2 finger protein ATL2 [Brassica rapa]XP_013751633.2 RING-H2 finger protein ATL2-like [Brassica napus]RID63487.1 hypothetical protein BRARA_E02489 [Brassica rapa]CAF2101020.1 unnamed protein product [Brassica napus]